MLLKLTLLILQVPGPSDSVMFQSYAGCVIDASPCWFLTVLFTHIDPFQYVFVPEGAGVIGALAVKFPEYQFEGLKPVPAAPITLDEFHCKR